MSLFAIAVLLFFKLAFPSRPEFSQLLTRRRFHITSTVVIALSFGLLWAVFAGYFGLLFGWTPDWNDIRADYVSTFASFRWPIRVEMIEGSRLLVAQLGLYLVPTFLVKTIFQQNLVIAQLLVAGYVAVGVSIVVAFIIRQSDDKYQKVLASFIFLTFGGLDVIGILARRDDPWNYVLFGGHLETWDGMLQVSNVTTLIFWVPHHALASWLGAVVIISYRKTPDFRLATVLVCSMALIWSPFAFVGLVVVGCIFFVVDRAWTARFEKIELSYLCAAVAMSVPTIIFYSLVKSVDIFWFFSATARENAGLGHISASRQVLRFLFFWSVEVGVWLVIARILGFSLRTHHYVAALSMIVLSLGSSWGPNDFMMRSVIAPHFIFLIPFVEQASELLMKSNPQKILAKTVLSIVILLASLTSVVEIIENYRRGPRHLETPCLISGCNSNIVAPQGVESFASRQSLIFRD